MEPGLGAVVQHMGGLVTLYNCQHCHIPTGGGCVAPKLQIHREFICACLLRFCSIIHSGGDYDEASVT
jgi:hypothetical protein